MFSLLSSIIIVLANLLQLDRRRALERQQQIAAYQEQMRQMRERRQQSGRPYGGAPLYTSPAGNPYQMGGSGYGGGFGGGGFGGGGGYGRRRGGFGTHRGHSALSNLN